MTPADNVNPLQMKTHQTTVKTCSRNAQSFSSRTGRTSGLPSVISVTLGQVGIIFGYEVSRLARNNGDWYQLLDICGFKGCLIADRDGIYDPATPNGRLLLGLNKPAS
jgi:hypothetical protein